MKHNYLIASIIIFTSSFAFASTSVETSGQIISVDYIAAVDQKLVCPENMVEIEGDYCPSVEQECLNVDKTIRNVNGFVRCLSFAPTKCLSEKKTHMHFCIDTYEASDKPGDIPPIMVSWVTAKSKCEADNKRLCIDNEWTLACEGPDILPYPYGYDRDSTACNIDHPQRAGFDASKSKMDEKTVAWLDQRVPSGYMDKCVSPYGVHDMTGNVDETVVNSSGRPYKSGLKGGHWVIGARNRCRPITLAHNEYFSNYESSYRCCKDILQIYSLLEQTDPFLYGDFISA